MKKLFVMVVAAGLGAGGGLIFLLEFFDNTFKRIEDVEEDLKLKVLCTVPEIVSAKKKIVRTIEHICSAAYALMSFALLVCFAILYLKGVEPTIEFIKKYISL